MKYRDRTVWNYPRRVIIAPVNPAHLTALLLVAALLCTLKEVKKQQSPLPEKEA
jgi:hypothetical protein